MERHQNGKTEDLQARPGQSSFNIYVWVTWHLRTDQMPDKFLSVSLIWNLSHSEISSLPMQCMSGPHKVNFPLITLTYIHVYITSRRPLLMFRLEYIWKPLVGVLSQFDLVFRNTCPWSKPGQKRSGWDEIFLFLLILPAGNFSHSKCAFRPNWAFSGNIETDYL